VTDWISQPENQLFLAGMALLVVGGWMFLLMAFPRRREEEPVESYEWGYEPVTAETAVIPAQAIAPNYIGVEEHFPLAGYLLAAIDAAADATEELTQVIEIKPVDPLDDTVELPVVDDDTPLYWSIPAPSRPRQYELETFTQGIQRAQLERAMAARAEQ
jgi:hypothetical protein